MVVWASDAEYVLSARQAYELGFQVPTVASPAITMDQVRDLCEPEWVEGWYSVTDFVGNSDDPEVTAFCDKYASDYGEGQKAELYVADVYSTFKLVFDAIERAGSATVRLSVTPSLRRRTSRCSRATRPATRTTCWSTPRLSR